MTACGEAEAELDANYPNGFLKAEPGDSDDLSEEVPLPNGEDGAVAVTGRRPTSAELMYPDIDVSVGCR